MVPLLVVYNSFELNAGNVYFQESFLTLIEQTDMARLTLLFILIQNIYTLYRVGDVYKDRCKLQNIPTARASQY